MALRRRHEADGAVAMLMVVPVRQLGDPAPCGQQVFKRFDRQLGPVLQGSERRFDIGVVVAHGRTAARVGHAQALHGDQHGLALHRCAIVRVHRQLAWGDALARADVSQQLAGQLGTLAVKHLPAHNLAAEQVLEQVQVKVLAAHLGRQIRNIPAEHLIGSGRGQGARAAALLRCTFRAPMGQLALLSQQPVHRGLRGHIDACVGQARHDLARRQVLEHFAVERAHHGLADVMGFDGRRVLIPSGSRLIGQYRSGLAAGQSRAFIVWTRLTRPDGVTVALGSPVTDPLGRAGLTGKVDSHFLKRFGSAILLSVVESGLGLLQRGGNDVVVRTADDAKSVAGIALQRDINIPPTIKVAQGTTIRIFTARDLDFSGTDGGMQ